MKQHKRILSVLLMSMTCAGGSAFAQGSGGGSGSSSGGAAGQGGGAQEMPNGASGATAPSHAKAKHKMMHHKKATKQMNDATNTPGADASSDTKGQ